MKDERSPHQRILGRDGKFNIQPIDSKSAGWTDLYHRLLTMRWPRLLTLIASFYLVSNFIFAGLYWLCGAGALEGLRGDDNLSRYINTFFFSIQTFATIGYGRVTPSSLGANFLVTVEALVGMMSLAVMTGLVFARFSKPTARVVFSNVAVVTTFQGSPSLVFRIANRRRNQIVEAQVSATVNMTKLTQEGRSYRVMSDLELLRSKSQIFILSWTVVHPINPQSPLYGMTLNDLNKAQAEIVVSLTGIDDTFSQTVHSRFSYLPDEIVWNRNFRDMFINDGGGKMKINLNYIHDLDPTI